MGVSFKSIYLDWEVLAAYMHLSLGGLLAFVMSRFVAKFRVNINERHLMNYKVWARGLLWFSLPTCLRVFHDLGSLYYVCFGICLIVLRKGPLLEVSVTIIQHPSDSLEYGVSITRF